MCQTAPVSVCRSVCTDPRLSRWVSRQCKVPANMTVYARLAIWGFSASGGHILAVAARNPDLAAAIAQTPLADAAAAMPAVAVSARPASRSLRYPEIAPFEHVAKRRRLTYDRHNGRVTRESTPSKPAPRSSSRTGSPALPPSRRRTPWQRRYVRRFATAGRHLLKQLPRRGDGKIWR